MSFYVTVLRQNIYATRTVSELVFCKLQKQHPLQTSNLHQNKTNYDKYTFCKWCRIRVLALPVAYLSMWLYS